MQQLSRNFEKKNDRGLRIYVVDKRSAGARRNCVMDCPHCSSFIGKLCDSGDNAIIVENYTLHEYMAGRHEVIIKRPFAYAGIHRGRRLYAVS